MPVDTDLTKWRVPLFPTLKPVADRPKPVRPSRPIARGRFVAHPRYRAWLAKCGIASADTVVSLTGEVVCGHPDRHVLRAELHSGVRSRVVYLKREHVVSHRSRLRNWLAGFGWVSRCEREAVTLSRLEAAGQPAPHWLAYGEDAHGRAFLLVDELAGASELRRFLADNELSHHERRALAVRIGSALAGLHEAGFDTPELAAKHLFVMAGGSGVSLIDWQSSPRPGVVGFAERADRLGTLHATLADELTTPRERMRVLWAYRRAVRLSRLARTGRPEPRWRFSAAVPEVLHSADRALAKSSIRSQRQPLDSHDPQRLVWLKGEAVVAVPETAGRWPSPPDGEPFYQEALTPTPVGGHRERVTFADGRRAVIARFRTADPLGRLVAAIRERPWRSPAQAAARMLFHLAKNAIPAPRLLAFGQRTSSSTASESFVVAETNESAVPLTVAALRVDDRRAALGECGRLLAKLHAAGCRPVAVAGRHDPLFAIDADRNLSVGSPFAVRLAKRLTDSERIADVRRFVATLPRADRFRVLRGYLGEAWADRAARKRYAARVV